MNISSIEEQRARDYEKARLVKIKELLKECQPEYERAKKAQDAGWLDRINGKVKDKIAEFSQTYWGVE